ncbi:hypothetical protein ACIBI7_51460, partial [Nonomuraea fuscirosea]|uniref:hypothetical protein n=1 Tax=Nonomuraea fuscirosea TaxID=1291556 RepID=UPI0037B82FC4
PAQSATSHAQPLSSPISSTTTYRKLAEITSVDPFYERTVQVSNILIMDVGASSFKEASATARTALERHGWVKSAEPITDHISMESPAWAFTSLRIAPIQDLAGWGADVPDSVMESPRADAYVLIVMTPLQ